MEYIEERACSCSNKSGIVAKAALVHRECAKDRNEPQKEVQLAIYCPFVNFLLAKYTTENVIAEARTEIISFKQSGHIFLPDVHKVCGQTRYVLDVSLKTESSGYFLEGVHESVRFKMKPYLEHIMTL